MVGGGFPEGYLTRRACGSCVETVVWRPQAVGLGLGNAVLQAAKAVYGAAERAA